MKKDDKKLALLSSLEEELKGSDGIGEVSVSTQKELNAPMDILRAEIADFGSDLKSVLGEFFFIPFEADEVLYFSTVITLTWNLPKEAAADVASAVARLNYYIPCGCFALGDSDNNLVYRLCVPLKGDDDTDRQKQTVSIAANTAIMTAEKFEGYLKLIITNETTVDEMLEMIQK